MREEIPRRSATKDPYDQRAKHVVLRVFVSYTGSTGFSACPRVFKKPDNYGEQYELRTRVLRVLSLPGFRYRGLLSKHLFHPEIAVTRRIVVLENFVPATFHLRFTLSKFRVKLYFSSF